MKIIFALIATILLTSCTGNKMEPTDFKDQKPRLIIEEYLSGNVKAWGILQNRSGKVTRQFSADLNGKWDGKQLILDEKFNWNDGEVQTRKWTIDKIDEHNYEVSKKLLADLLCVAPKLGEKMLDSFNKKLVCGVKLYSAWEQFPDKNNQINLSKMEFDKFGIPRTILKWKKNVLLSVFFFGFE